MRRSGVRLFSPAPDEIESSTTEATRCGGFFLGCGAQPSIAPKLVQRRQIGATVDINAVPAAMTVLRSIPFESPAPIAKLKPFLGPPGIDTRHVAAVCATIQRRLSRPRLVPLAGSPHDTPAPTQRQPGRPTRTCGGHQEATRRRFGGAGPAAAAQHRCGHRLGRVDGASARRIAGAAAAARAGHVRRGRAHWRGLRDAPPRAAVPAGRRIGCATGGAALPTRGHTERPCIRRRSTRGAGPGGGDDTPRERA